uniref:Uncharacterized protein n=1 Tax=viral metagenome TaxID=1070528 RepID=A0A6C0LMJ0_9ZZZZ
MNIQDNAQKNTDYYKELKTVRKEIEKIYKQLSKDETFSEMIATFQEILNKNITFISSNLTKPIYKEFNPKITKILVLLIELLKTCTAYEEYEASDNEPKLETLISKLNESETYEHNLKIIDDNIKEIEETYKGIIRHILIFTYCKTLFEKNSETSVDKAKIKSITDQLNTTSSPEEKKAIEAKLAETKIEIDKDKYKRTLNHIQLSSFEIFDYVDKRYTELTELETEDDSKAKPKKKDEGKKEKEQAVSDFIEQFKQDIYYRFINITNARSDDPEMRQNDIRNEKIDLDLRRKLLDNLKEDLDKQLNTLNNIVKFLVDSNKQEYTKEITNIQKSFKDYSKEKEYKDNILSIVVNEEGDVKNSIKKTESELEVLEKKIKLQEMELERDRAERKRNDGGYGRPKKMFGGERKPKKYYEDKYKPINVLIEAIDDLIKQIAKTEGKEDGDKDPFSKKYGMFGDAEDDVPSIYNTIWHDYKKEMNKIKSKGVTLDSLKQDNRLYERFKMNELDPQDVLKITFQDKVIFICIVLIIRTFAMVLIELLIEYNFVSTLSRGIIVYSVLYVLLLLTSVLIINYDSYKLRILVNYLNVHINSSNIFFHVLLFALFIGLILIIINDREGDNNLKGVDNIFNYTYVYKYIYEIAEKSKPTSDLLLTQKEKVKLQYRMDIITMIIFIFSSLLILIM